MLDLSVLLSLLDVAREESASKILSPHLFQGTDCAYPFGEGQRQRVTPTLGARAHTGSGEVDLTLGHVQVT